MKEHSASVYGGQNLHTSTIMHKLQPDIAIEEHMQIMSAQVKSSPVWNNDLPMAGHVIELEFDLCHKVWENQSNYKVCHALIPFMSSHLQV